MLKKKLDGESQGFEIDDDLFNSKEQALEVYKLLDSPVNYEIIYVQRHKYSKSSRTLGFDIGFWGGDHFSLIADTIIVPTWHVPIPKDYKELANRLTVLNDNLLFNSVQDAEDFRNYYKTKDWAETESEAGEFCVIQVDLVKVPT